MKRFFFFLFLLAISILGQTQNINPDFDKFLMRFSNLNLPLNTLGISNQGWVNYRKNKETKISDELVKKYIIKNESDLYYNYIDYDMAGGAVKGNAKYWFFYIGKIKINDFYLLLYQKTNDDTTWTYLSVYTLKGENRQVFIVNYISDNKCEKAILDENYLLTICDYELLKESYTRSFYIKNKDTVWTGGLQLKNNVKYKTLISIFKYRFDFNSCSFVEINKERKLGIGGYYEYCSPKRENLPEDDPR